MYTYSHGDIYCGDWKNDKFEGMFEFFKNLLTKKKGDFTYF